MTNAILALVFLTKLRQYNFHSPGDKITCFTDQNDPVWFKKFLIPAVQEILETFSHATVLPKSFNFGLQNRNFA